MSLAVLAVGAGLDGGAKQVDMLDEIWIFELGKVGCRQFFSVGILVWGAVENHNIR